MAIQDDEPQVEVARPQDYSAIAAMHLRSWTMAYQTLIRPDCLALYDVSGFIQEYDTLVAHGHVITAVVDRSASSVTGVAIFHPARGKIEALYTHPRGRGTGTRLFEHALATISVDTVTLDCAQGNCDGCNYWESRGFVRAGIGEPFDPHCDAVIPTWRYSLNRPDR